MILILGSSGVCNKLGHMLKCLPTLRQVKTISSPGPRPSVVVITLVTVSATIAISSKSSNGAKRKGFPGKHFKKSEGSESLVTPHRHALRFEGWLG